MMLLATLLLTLTAQTAWASSAFSGSGTEGDPYLIASTTNLNNLAIIVNGGNDCEGKFFKMTANITYDGTANNYTPIGDIDHPFKGTFDGQGHSISGIRISDTNDNTGEDKAIFGMVIEGTVKNLVVNDCSIVAYQKIGGIASRVEGGTIENCHVSSDVTLTGHMYVGGIVAQNLGATIKGCTSAAAISGTENGGQNADNLGGIAGYTTTNSTDVISPTLTDNLFTGTISGELREYIGAIVGQNYSATPIFTNNFYTTNVLGGTTDVLSGVGAEGSTTGVIVGGIKFANEYNSEPDDIGAVVKTYGTGSYVGLTLYAYGMYYSGKYYYNAVVWPGSGTAVSPYIITTTQELDYLAAQVNGGNTYLNTYFELGGNINYGGTENIYTPIGANGGSFSGTFDGKGYSISGININKPGEQYKAVFDNAGGTGTIKNLTVRNSSIICYGYAGGIVARSMNERIENCHVGSDVTLSGNNYVGGIAGDYNGGTIIGCTSAATITGTESGGRNAEKLGGIVGSIMNGSTLTDNLFLGIINGDLNEYIGAITGVDDTSWGANSFTNNAYTFESENNIKGVGKVGSITGTDKEGTRKAKNIATCTATVPNQAMKAYSTVDNGDRTYSYIFNKFEEANSPATYGVSVGETVKDGETTLILGTDYTFGNVYYSDMTGMNEPKDNGDICLVEIRGIGAYAGTIYALFTIIPPDANGTWGANLTWTFHDGTLTISGTGAMDAAASNSGYPWFSNASYTETITIGEGITSIAASAFAGTGDVHYYDNVVHVNLPSTLTTIGESAFAYCTCLAALTIPYGVTTINNSAFLYCDGLPSIIIPASVTSIGSDAFYGCTNISEVYCYVTDPSKLTWTDGSCNDFMADKTLTTCHVFSGTDWSSFASDVCVTFVGDLATITFNLTELEGVSHLAALAGKTLPVQFSRTFDANSNKAGKASTLCLPFAFDKPDKTTVGTFYTFGGVDNTSGEYVVTMTEVTDATLTVGTPYLFQPVAGSELTFGNASFTVPGTITAGKTVVDGWAFTGTFKEITWPSGQTQLYAFAASNFEKSDGSLLNEVGAFRRFDYGHANPFRCYLWAPGGADPNAARGVSSASTASLPESMKVILVSASGETTGIGTLDTRTGEVTFGEEWYSLDGRKLDGKPTKKGLYINKGKTVVIK